MKGDTPKDDIGKELNDLMNEKSEHDYIKDNKTDKESLRTADALRVGRPRINSTTEEETRTDTLSNEKIMKDKKPEEKMSLDWNKLFEEEEMLKNDLGYVKMSEDEFSEKKISKGKSTENKLKKERPKKLGSEEGKE